MANGIQIAVARADIILLWLARIARIGGSILLGVCVGRYILWRAGQRR